jgi:hypothetical protein
MKLPNSFFYILHQSISSAEKSKILKKQSNHWLNRLVIQKYGEVHVMLENKDKSSRQSKKLFKSMEILIYWSTEQQVTF